MIETLNNYKNIFLNPREFANDKLYDAWPWWTYALIILGWNVLSSGVFAVLFGIPLTFAVLSAIGSATAILVMLTILNAPFKTEDLTWEDTMEVCLSYYAYILPLMIIIQIISISAIAITPAATLFLALPILVLSIWIPVSLFKIISELHNTSAWKVFGIFVLLVVLIGIAITMYTTQKVEEMERAIKAQDDAEYQTKGITPSSTQEEIEAVLTACKALTVEDWQCPLLIAQKILPEQYDKAVELCSTYEEKGTSYENCIQGIADGMLEHDEDIAFETCTLQHDSFRIAQCSSLLSFKLFEQGRSVPDVLNLIKNHCTSERIDLDPNECLSRATYELLLSTEGKYDDTAMQICDSIVYKDEWDNEKDSCYAHIGQDAENPVKGSEACRKIRGEQKTMCFRDVAGKYAELGDARALEVCKESEEIESCISWVVYNSATRHKFELATTACNLQEGTWHTDCVETIERERN